MESNGIEHMKNTIEAYLKSLKFDDEGIPTATSNSQENVEENVLGLYMNYDEFPDLKKSLHKEYLLNTLWTLPDSYEVMDSSRTWIVYWTLHSLALLNHDIDNATKYNVIQFLKSCQHEDGGFGGGPGQNAHLAPTYAAVNAICILGTTEAYNIINRKSLKNFLIKMRVGDGSFYMHDNGEVDMRSVYCCLVVVSLLNLEINGLFDKSVDWISSCQTYEGGFSGTPGMEAHGGYTFCGVCALYLLGRLDKTDRKSLKRWVLNRQTSLEGGFQGRTNKLVDSCYTFWQCASLAILNYNFNHEHKNCENDWYVDNIVLQEYLLICCQHVSGGFVDKPTTSHDPYHTCYSLSGLSLAHTALKGCQANLGINKLLEIHPVYNLPMKAFQKATSYFKGAV